MALNLLLPEDERYEYVEPTIQPSRTYSLDLTNGRLGGMLDGKEAIRQFILKTIKTARFRFLVYNDEYGSELEDLIGQDVPIDLLETEIKRVITESLIYDERIEAVTNFVITRDSDRLFISFDVDTVEGTISQEVMVANG